MGLVGIFSRWRARSVPMPIEAEYWTFLSEARLPDQTALLQRLLHENPYGKARNPVGTGDALILSDVRLHIALVLREKNESAFRPDLFLSVENREHMDALMNAKAFVRLRYRSEETIFDRRHLRFLVHAADAYADLAGGLGIFDRTAERFFGREELRASLRADPGALSSSLHLNRSLRPSEEGEIAFAKGFGKIGLPDLETYPVPFDGAVTLEQVFEGLCDRIWNEGPEATQVEFFGDQFKALPTARKGKPTRLRIQRFQTP